VGTVLLRVNEATSMAWHTMAVLASNGNGLLSTRRMAGMLRASEAHLAKVLQRLGKAGLVCSVRGRRGGFRLAKPAREVSLLDIYESMEGPLRASSCLLGEPICDGDNCLLGDLLDCLNERVAMYLSETRIGGFGAFPHRTSQPGRS